MADPLPISRAPRPLGRTSIRVFPISFGCWRMVGDDVKRARRSVETARECGIDLFDTADIYGLGHGGGALGQSEELLGKVMAESPELRARIVLATKGGIVPRVPYDSSARHLSAACEASLQRLGVDCVDLYQIHRPDVLAHPEETAGALARLREAGKIREVGVSNYTTAQFDALQRYLPFPIATHQPELSALAIAPIDDGLLDQCLRERVTPLAWSPLAGGRLGLSAEEAERSGAPDAARLAAVIRALDKTAEKKGASRAAVALAFLLAHPAGVVPIVGTQQPARILECVSALDVPLERWEWYRIFAAARGAPLP
jgi:aryl-alcohol dehydrogenase-like predicted oxidoreductase